MPNSSDENGIEAGLTMLSHGRYEEAAAFFESAMRLGGDRQTVNRRMRCLSYYGLSVALANRPTPEAIKACEVAARRNFYSAELQLNLGKVYMLAGKTTRALAAFERGLQIAPRNRALKNEIAGSDRRRRPPIPWIRRNHPVNRVLGRVRASLKASRAIKGSRA
ncbi:MAG TPA: tetratricopeptide repeat protein [Candidatus Polarisedimenticolia bacterium]|jgi:tetratricopeptide (TPR) repeat protein